MKNNENIYAFLQANGFELIQKNKSASFGDYSDILTNGSFQIRLSSSKSFETVDICSNMPNQNWYDLALVKALLYNEKNLNKATSIEEHEVFLQKELVNVTKLFNEKNYPATKNKLEELGNERAKQMFSG